MQLCMLTCRDGQTAGGKGAFCACMYFILSSYEEKIQGKNKYLKKVSEIASLFLSTDSHSMWLSAGGMEHHFSIVFW